ncbi:centrosomal protein of 104 kDa-like [Amphiura filiformis]|uniref:centrosomal protein of 104 kDa-like n=1 Tax=Amphiura filiformis TaxID=82378 RepID=UPI003B227B6F
MPQRIHYSVIHASSTENGYNMKELESHHHQVKGWLSSRFCIYPQEVILNLKEKTRLRQIQILAHEYLIPTKIDFYVGLTAPDHMTKSHHKEYKLLGYTLFGDNATTERKLRELRSISVDAVGQYLRLVLDKNHVNKYNLFNQVGLIAVNVIGDNKFTEDADSEDPRVVNKKIIDEFLLLQSKFKDSEGDPVNPALVEAAAREGYIASTDDLAFDMYQDPEIATLIRKMETKRNEATKDRLFTLAKRLEKAINNLKRAGKVISQYDVEKRRAVEKEDYDFARQKKMQIDDYRRKLYKEMELEDLCRHCVIDFWFEKYSWDTVIDEYTPSRDIPHRPPSHPFLRDPSLQREEMPFVPQSLGPFEPFMYEPITDDRPLPTLASSKDPDSTVLPPSFSAGLNVSGGTSVSAETSISVASPPPEESSQTGGTTQSNSGVGSHAPDIITEEMMQKIRKQSGDAMEIFGQEMVIKIHSKNWSLREEGFKSLTSHLKQLDEGCNKEELRHKLNASVTLSVRGVKDKVLAVFTATLHLLSVILDNWIPKHKFPAGHTVEIILPELMARIGDTNQRLKSAAIEFIVSMATYKEVYSLKVVPYRCVTPFKPTVQTKVALSRLEIVQKLLGKLELDAKSGLTISNTATFAKQAMEHTQAAVREAAVNLIHELYKLRGSEVIGHLPAQDDPKVQANKSLYGRLFKGLSKFVVSQIKAKTLANMSIPDNHEYPDDSHAELNEAGGTALEGTSNQVPIITESDGGGSGGGGSGGGGGY